MRDICGVTATVKGPSLTGAAGESLSSHEEILRDKNEWRAELTRQDSRQFRALEKYG